MNYKQYKLCMECGNECLTKNGTAGYIKNGDNEYMGTGTAFKHYAENCTKPKKWVHITIKEMYEFTATPLPNGTLA
jgi:hypothetical protein